MRVSPLVGLVPSRRRGGGRAGSLHQVRTQPQVALTQDLPSPGSRQAGMSWPAAGAGKTRCSVSPSVVSATVQATGLIVFFRSLWWMFFLICWLLNSFRSQFKSLFIIQGGHTPTHNNGAPPTAHLCHALRALANRTYLLAGNKACPGGCPLPGGQAPQSPPQDQ